MSFNANPAATADYFLGFDVSKLKLDVSLIDANGVELWADKVANNEVAIAEFLLTLGGHYSNKRLSCVVESTGVYHLALAEMSYALGLPCQVYNPIITKAGIRGSVRGKKTDRTDALLIARMGLRGEGRPYTPEPYLAAKHYARSCQKLSILSASFKVYERHFTDLLRRELRPEATARLTGVQHAIQAAKTQLSKDLAASATSDIFTRLQTIPGVGPYVAASLIGEIQTMKRFTTAEALVAYAGLDPRVRQSGSTINSMGRLTKRGSTYLRRSLFLAANAARQHDPHFQALYDKKRAEGKPYTVATCVVARKLLVVSRAVWLSERVYDANFIAEKA